MLRHNFKHLNIEIGESRGRWNTLLGIQISCMLIKVFRNGLSSGHILFKEIFSTVHIYARFFRNFNFEWEITSTHLHAIINYTNNQHYETSFYKNIALNTSQTKPCCHMLDVGITLYGYLFVQRWNLKLLSCFPKEAVLPHIFFLVFRCLILS